MDVADRAVVLAALGDEARLRIVDALAASDRTFAEVSEAAGLPGNAAAHHLLVLERAGLIERRASDGDRRRRYIRLRYERLADLLPAAPAVPDRILFVCSHNSARSQFAAALWTARTGRPAESAGREPAAHVHPLAAEAARSFGLDIAAAVPKGYDAVALPPALVVSVCDQAREAGLPFEAPAIHWSVPDPVVAGDLGSFRSAFADIAERIDRLTARAA